MSFSVNTNAGALKALQSLNATSRSLDVTQNRINTGLKVSSAKDNAAAFAIAQKLRGDIAGLRAVHGSLDRAASEVDVAIAGAQAVSDLLIQMREKAVAAKDDGLDDDSRTALNNDYQQLLSQVDSIANNAVFNGKNLLTGDSLSAITDATGSSTITASVTSVTTSSLSLDTTSLAGGASVPNTAVSSGSGNPWSSGDTLNALNNYVETNFNSIYTGGNYNNATGDFTLLAEINTVGLGIISDFGATPGILASSGQFLYLSSGSLYVEGSGGSAQFTSSATSSSGGDPDAAVTAVDAAIDTVNGTLSDLGATSNRLAIQQQFSAKLSDGLNIGIGNLVDADLARESANLQAFQTKQQLGLQALSIANQTPQTILSLFR